MGFLFIIRWMCLVFVRFVDNLVRPATMASLWAFSASDLVDYGARDVSTVVIISLVV